MKIIKRFIFHSLGLTLWTGRCWNTDQECQRPTWFKEIKIVCIFYGQVLKYSPFLTRGRIIWVFNYKNTFEDKSNQTKILVIQHHRTKFSFEWSSSGWRNVFPNQLGGKFCLQSNAFKQNLKYRLLRNDWQLHSLVNWNQSGIRS